MFWSRFHQPIQVLMRWAVRAHQAGLTMQDLCGAGDAVRGAAEADADAGGPRALEGFLG